MPEAEAVIEDILVPSPCLPPASPLQFHSLPLETLHHSAEPSDTFQGSFQHSFHFESRSVYSHILDSDDSLGQTSLHRPLGLITCAQVEGLGILPHSSTSSIRTTLYRWSLHL